MEIRQACVYIREMKDRYYVTSTGVVYTECKDNKVMVDGALYRVTKHMRNEAKSSDKEFYIPFKALGMKCIVLRNGTVLRSLKTRIKECGSVVVSMFNILNVEKKIYVSRLVAACFIADIAGKEVHHIDHNRSNNNVENLQVLSFEEHRGKGSHKENHYQV